MLILGAWGQLPTLLSLDSSIMLCFTRLMCNLLNHGSKMRLASLCLSCGNHDPDLSVHIFFIKALEQLLH